MILLYPILGLGQRMSYMAHRPSPSFILLWTISPKSAGWIVEHIDTSWESIHFIKPSKLHAGQVYEPLGARVEIVHINMVPITKLGWLYKVHDHIISGSLAVSVSLHPELDGVATAQLSQGNHSHPHWVGLPSYIVSCQFLSKLLPSFHPLPASFSGVTKPIIHWCHHIDPWLNSLS